MHSPKALGTYLGYLEARARGEAPEFETFRADHPEFAGELDAIHALWSAGSPGVDLGESTYLHPRREVDGEFDPGIRLDGEPSSAQRSDQAAERYSIRDEIARGGMGLIYKVWDGSLRRSLAMKVILGPEGGASDSNSVDRTRLNRFLEEAQVTGQLDHPGIVPVHDLGLDPQGRVFFTMKLVRGQDLKAVLKLLRAGSEGWTLTRALGTLLRVCEAMAFAHEKGVVHRDLKPANIMVGGFGEVYVMDWGLAKVLGRKDSHDLRVKLDAAASMTRVRTDRRDQRSNAADANSPLFTMDGDVLGTPCYMSPEQARGEVEELGPHSDVYSAGSILYEMLTGRMPYVPASGSISPQAVIGMLLHGPPRPVAECNPRVAPELVAICEKAMAREIDQRYASMLEMAEDLRAYLEERVVSAYETGTVAELRKWIRRNRGMAALASGLVLVVTLGSIAFALQQKSLAQRIEVQRVETVRARDAALESERLARRRSYLAHIAAADVGIKAGEAQDAVRRLEDCEPDLRGWEWRHLALRAESNLSVLRHDLEVTSVALSPAGTLAATGCADRIVRLWDPDQGQLVAELSGHEDGVVALDFSPDGTRLASASRDGSVRIWSTPDGAFLFVLSGHEAPLTAVAWSPDGSQLASASSDGVVHLWSGTGRSIVSTPPADVGVASLAWHPQGARLACGTADGEIRELDGATFAPLVARSAHHEGPVLGLAFSLDGEVLVSCSTDGTLRQWRGAGAEGGSILHRQTDPIFRLAYSPSSGSIAIGSLDRTVRVVDAVSGELRYGLQGHTDAVRSLAWGADGLRILSGSADGTARVWAAGMEGAALTLEAGDEPVAGLAMLREGPRIAASGRFSGDLTVWDASSGSGLLHLPGGDDSATGIAASSDGRWLAVAREGATIDLFDARSGTPLGEPLAGHEASVEAVAFSPDGLLLASASADQTVRLWELPGGRAVAVLGGHGGAATCVAFAPCGWIVASGSLDGLVRLWERDEGRLLRTLEGHADGVAAVSFAPDGSRLASCSRDGTIRLWDASSGAQTAVLRGHAGAVNSVAFAPDGSRLASASFDKTVRVWDSSTGDALLALRGHGGPVVAVSFDPEGDRLVSGSFDGRVLVWETTPTRGRFAARVTVMSLAISRMGDLDLEQYARARVLAETARKLGSGGAGLRAALGAALVRQGDFSAALAAFDDGGPAHPDERIFRALALAHLGRVEEARAALESVPETYDPLVEETRALLGN